MHISSTTTCSNETLFRLQLHKNPIKQHEHIQKLKKKTKKNAKIFFFIKRDHYYQYFRTRNNLLLLLLKLTVK